MCRLLTFACGMNTIDLVRLYERGSPAQKLWAVVLLLAVKDGVTRVWYDPSRGDCRLGYEIGGVEYAIVPPPESVQGLLPKVIGNLIHRRTVRRFIARLFVGAVARPTSVEGAFVVKVGLHRVTVSASLDLSGSRVVLRLSPEATAAPAARDALESVLSR